MEDWITVEEEVIDEMPCVCTKGMQYKVKLLEFDQINKERRTSTFVKVECPNNKCSSNINNNI